MGRQQRKKKITEKLYLVFFIFKIVIISMQENCGVKTTYNCITMQWVFFFQGLGV